MKGTRDLLSTSFLALIFLPLATAVNILGLMSTASPSHHNWNRQIFYKLAAQGHNLTVLSADVDKEVTPGLHYIWAEKVYSHLYNGSEALNLMEMVDTDTFTGVQIMWNFCLEGCQGYYASDGFQTLLNYPDDFKFDLVIMDFTLEPCLIGFLDKFNYPPLIGVTAFSNPHYSYDYVGGHKLPSYVPHFGSGYAPIMDFHERVMNFLTYFYDDWYRVRYVRPLQDASMKRAFKNAELPSVSELNKKMVLILANTHFSLEKIEPLPPNIIPVGGLQIQPPKPLDAELEAFVQRAKKGVVLFSLGTNMKSAMMGDAQKKMFIEAFKHFPDYNFIWKYESDLELPLPPNVKTLGWLRQSDILAHKKTKAFISHCGQLGTQEAAWHGIPVVGLPFFSDQFRNIRAGIREGTSVKLDYFKLTAGEIKAALQKVLGEPSYYRNAQRRSQLFQDQPEKPIDRALFWIEWVLRHKDNTGSIQLPIRDMSFIVSNSYDVIFFLLSAVALTVSLIFWILMKLCCAKKSEAKKLKRQ